MRMITLILCVCFWGQISYAQEQPFAKSISVDFLGAILPNHPVDVLYRKTNPKVTWRVGLALSGANRDQSAPNTPGSLSEAQSTFIRSGLSLGWQKEKTVGAFQVYGGMDLQLGYDYRKNNNKASNTNLAANLRLTRLNESTHHTGTIGLKPLAGFVFKPIPQISLGLEYELLFLYNLLWANYFRSNISTSVDTQDIIDQEELAFQSFSDFWSIQTFPGTHSQLTLWLGFHFN